MSFPGIPALSELVDRQLAAMTGVDQNLRGRYQTLSEYTQYFWKTAQARDATYFKASVKDVVGDIVAVELGTTQFLTGAAHGIPATHYLNWQRSQGRPLTLDEVLIPSRKAEYVVAMREAHQRWLAANEDAQHDRAAYDRMWPFQETTNFALTRQGWWSVRRLYHRAVFARTAGNPHSLRAPARRSAPRVHPGGLSAGGGRRRTTRRKARCSRLCRAPAAPIMRLPRSERPLRPHRP